MVGNCMQIDKLWVLVKHNFLYLVISLLNMLSPGQSLSVCLSVCLSVTAFYLNTVGPISMKL